MQRSSWADLWEYLGPFTKEFDLNRRIQNRSGSNSHYQKRSDSTPTQDRQLKFPVVTEKGRPLSRCAQGMLRKFLEDGPYWEYRDRGFRVIADIQLYSGLPEPVKNYALIEVDAFTFGNSISFRDGIDPASLDNFNGLVLLAHEFAHSLQADRYGPRIIFGALYLIRSGTVSLKGKDPYVDNQYEVDARDFENAFRDWLEREYGRADPCKKYMGGK
jgi:hypothetical protein